jgi:hypothetical protein
MGQTSDEITGKAGNEMRQARTHTWAPSTSPKQIESGHTPCEDHTLQDLSFRVNPKMTKEVMHHADL